VRLFSIIVLFALSTVSVHSQNIDIGLFHNKIVNEIILSTESGRYQIIGDSSHIITVKKNTTIKITFSDSLLIVKDLDAWIGIFKTIELAGLMEYNSFIIQVISPKQLKQRAYTGDLKIIPNPNSIKIINRVDLEQYVAGVVECEGGTKANLEYYKTQAIICRTYALKNYYRHIDENFNLCSDVHCQAYLHKAEKSEAIKRAVKLTKGLVIVDTTLNLITATFHSNSGGQTMSSEMVWLSQKSYLKSVTDTFSISQRNYNWEKEIPLWKWRTMIEKNGFPISRISTQDLAFLQGTRKMYYKIGNDSMLLKDIRAEMQLRSTFFSVIPKETTVLLKGKGYGHGVGLSQEGAMVMSKNNYNYREIVNYYYQNVFIVSLRALEFFKEE
jgi:stage II sporulation protein D